METIHLSQPPHKNSGRGTFPLLNVLIRDREGILFQGTAESVTSFNAKGEFDILSLHTNFISIISDRIIVRSNGIAAKTIQLQTGILKVKGNSVEVYLGILH